MVWTFLSYLWIFTKIEKRDIANANATIPIFSKYFHFFVTKFVITIHRIKSKKIHAPKITFSVMVSTIVNIANETINSIYFD